MDIFSRFHWLAPLQRKFPFFLAPHLKKIFSEHRPLDRLQSGDGGEFRKKVVKVRTLLFLFFNIFFLSKNFHNNTKIQSKATIRITIT